LTTHVCTIIARNYLPAARVLAASVFRHHPDALVSVLVIDQRDEPAGPDEPFDLLRLEEIGLDPGELEKMAAVYDVMELSTAVKPWLLATLLKRGASAVLYLDPDIEVYAPLDEIAALAMSESIVLTPHVTAPVPRDHKSVAESELLASGMYNLGFVAVSAAAGGFLAFWQERLRRECVVDPLAMRFVDQRWVDFVPGVFGAAIVRSPAYNVAYWNLDHRDLDHDGERYRVDGEPLRFFHFSGYRPSTPYLLSRHQGGRPRILLSERPELAQLCDAYGAALLAAGYDALIAAPYGYAALENGLAYDPVMRALYRAALIAFEEAPAIAAAGLGGSSLVEPPNPFVAGGAEAFLSWLNEIPPERPEGQVTRYLGALYESRIDLQAAFADIDGDGFARFAEWSLHEVGQGRLDPRLAIPVAIAAHAKRRAADPASEPRPPRAPGIRIAGYLRAETGVGELGRLAARCAEAAGVVTSTYVDSHSVSRQAHGYEASRSDQLDVNLVCVNADELPHFARRVGPRFFEDRYTIGLWAWELEEFPRRYAPSFSYLDEVWGISEFTADAIRAISPVPVYAFPLPILEPSAATPAGRSDLGLPEGYVFLFCFDMMSIVERKNPFGLIEAFSRAFEPGEGPQLVIKAVNSALKQPDLERMKWVAAKRPDITILDRYLTADANRALMGACDCYVSLHRSEGFGLTMAEAMALGKPVIATGYSGNMGFMREDTAYLVPWSPGEVPVATDPYPHHARWAEPDLDAAASLMREVVDQPAAAAARGAAARREVIATQGVEARAGFIRDRLAHAEAVLADQRRTTRRGRLRLGRKGSL